MAILAPPEERPIRPRTGLPIDPNFGPRLKELREAAGLSQGQLAVKIGVTRQAVSLWELSLRDPGWAEIQAIRRVLNVTCEDLDADAGSGIPRRLKRGAD